MRGDKKSVALNGKPSDNNDLAMRQVNKNESCHIGTDKAMRQNKNKKECRIDKPSPQQASTSNATGDLYSPVRENQKDAWKVWSTNKTSKLDSQQTYDILHDDINGTSKIVDL